VWLAHYEGDYDPGWTLGVYATREGAQRACEAEARRSALLMDWQRREYPHNPELPETWDSRPDLSYGYCVTRYEVLK
jgi:hypothetical protein